jgi:hypothetical protein
VFTLVLITASSIYAQSGAIRPRGIPGPSGTALATTGQSTVKGRVVYKDNGQPLKNVRVRIFTTEDGSLVALTNNQGEFRVSNLAAGKYYVSLDGPGVAMQSGFGVRLPLPINAIPRQEDFPEVTPKHDAVFTVDGTNAVEVEVKVARGGTISGKIMKANGSPFPFASVDFLSREGGTNTPYTAKFSAQADKDGFYKINNIPEGEYIVATAVENKSASFDIRSRIRGESQIVTYHPSAISVRDAGVVRVVTGGEAGGVNITLVPRSTRSVSGIVMQQRDGTPLVGATVLLRNKESEMGGSLVPGLAQRTTRTDADGNWTFSNVMEGEYVVTALAPRTRSRDFQDPADPEQAFRNSRMRFLVASQDIAVAGADLSGLTLLISGPGSIVGTIQTDNGAQLPANFVIFVELVSKTNRPSPPLPVRVRPDGSFVMDGIQSGETYVGFALPAGANAFIKSVSLNGTDLQDSPVRIQEGAEAGPMQIVISQAVGSLKGTVAPERSNQDISEYVVLLAPVETGKQRFRTSYLTSRLAADGSFSVTGAPGEYFVFAKRREDLPGIVSEEFVRTQLTSARRVVLVAGQEKRLDLTAN